MRSLTAQGSYRAAAELAGCDHHAELVVRSQGRIRADVVHKRIAAMGFAGIDAYSDPRS
ncbi:hypothetical protein OG413_28275 [Streptomyces sp. NBC_01433]|uniref:hypothetical protein n=1 Tax=Streptomyces sp. NBC_01433 TaxID=2903864 RepID=UPI002250BFB5|nr:hypothetical protein [Streptomyces sp. NBC_01433]MCX4679156.1 hypothetical protein [Streptomyces sp. NBC_01433]